MIAPDTLSGEMAGTRGNLLGLVVKTTVLTVATLGLYSFWARTRIRRWLWSSLRIGGVPFEYAGRPLEKLMGFVIAAVIVGVYLGLIVMLLIFASLNLTGGPGAGTGAALLLLVPVYWIAKYRGQRYLLNHTRWRGVAFSMEAGAWGYAARAAFWSIATILTCGILLPVRTHRLWKYRAERTFYGESRFRLAVGAGALYAPFVPVLIGAAVSGLSIWGLIATNDLTTVLILLPMLLLLFFGWINWRVASFQILASGLRLGDHMSLRVEPRTRSVIGIHLVGWILMAMLFVGIGIVGLFGFGFFARGAQAQFDLQSLESLSPYVVAAGGALFYLTFFVLRGALRIAMVSFPLFRHVADTLVIGNSIEVAQVRRGASAHMADADGFANLFDMGSGI
ncbi:YjgN family protein [Jannaschia sp. S6380]|uniref:DUF898 family protein n=1 Tax=Jannaschia sp. S6380 TaxID=2926408 RepID=UPI001FF118AC|nr:DUF898 family protein [Jannaschia sp. S6380]MCK0169410.1 YjgN family protein [Jannaschia sp. S6380]